jgi:hypothetical protein
MISLSCGKYTFIGTCLGSFVTVKRQPKHPHPELAIRLEDLRKIRIKWNRKPVFLRFK